MADKRLVPEPLIYDRQGDSTVLRPQASPVDNFVRAPEPVKSPLWDVAQAIAEVNPKLNKYIDEKNRQAAAEDAKKAESDAMVSEAKSWQEAIDKGLVQPGQSPLYQRVYEETLGKNSALTEAQATLTNKWYAADNPLKNSQDPAAINKWMADNTKELLAGKSPDFIKGFAPQLNAVKQQLVQHWIAEGVQNLQEDNKNAFGVLQRNRIMTLAKSGASASSIAEALANDAIPQQFAGLARKDINKLQAQAIIDVAVSTGNTNILKVGYEDRPDIKTPGRTIPGVFNIPGFAQHAQAAENSILSKAHIQESRALTAQTRADSANLAKAIGDEAVKMRNDPNYQVDDATFSRIAHMPHGATILQATLAAARKTTARPFDPVADASLIQKYVDVTAPGSNASLEEKQAAVTAVLPMMTTPAQVATLYQSIQKKDGQDMPLLHSEPYKQAQQGIKDYADLISRKIDSPQLASLADEVKSKLMAFTFQYDMDHAGSINLADFAKEINAKRQQYIKELQDKLEAGTTAPGTLPGGNARPGTKAPTPQAPAGATPAAPAAAPAATPQAQQQSSTAPAPAAPAAPAAPTSIANAIPVDRLLAPIPRSNISTIPETTVPGGWVPKTTEGLDFQTINILRSDPNKEVNGKPLWQHFEERYGEGAARFLLTANSGEIKYILKKSGFHNIPSKPFTTSLDEIGKVIDDVRMPGTK